MRLKDKVAIVTGGGRGIGSSICLAFAREGADIVVAARTSEEIQGISAELERLGGQALALKTDVSQREDVRNMVDRTIREFGKVDILVNNAGVQGPIGATVDTDIDCWIETVKINLIGSYLCSKGVLPYMIKQKRGKIINLSGGGSVSPRPFFSAYGVSKAALVRFTETLAEEVKEFNIDVNAIAPGAINTRMLDEVLEAGESAGEKALAQARRQKENGGVPLERPAALALFLASDESNGLTGRLISSVYDDWESMNIAQVMSSELYTVRRIDRI